MLRSIRSPTDLVGISDVVHTEDVVIGHYVNEVSKHSSWINFEALFIFAPSFAFFLEYVSVFVLAFLFAYLLGLYLKQRNPWQFPVRFFYNLFSPEDPEFTSRSAVGVLFLFTLFFLFLVKQIIGNNIKTEVCRCLERSFEMITCSSNSKGKLKRFGSFFETQMVVVDTSQIIDSVESLQKTSKGKQSALQFLQTFY